MTTFAAISLLAPAMLGGLVMVALPIIAHLLTRRIRRRIVFPSIALLTKTAASSASILRLRRLILLAVRTLAVAAIVLAFAWPAWFGPGAIARPGASHAVVFVLDNSASTRQIVQGRSVADFLRTRAADMLEQLRPGRDVANVVYAEAEASAEFGNLSTNLEALAAAMREREPTYGRADLHGALHLAGAMLKEHAGPRRLIVLTDGQRTAWEDGLAAPDRLASALPRDVEVTVIAPEEAAPANVSLAAPRWTPARPSAGRPARLSVELTNRSGADQTRTVRGVVGGQTASFAPVRILAGQTMVLTADITPAAAGPLTAQLTMDADAYAPDDTVYAAATVSTAPGVLVITTDDPDRPGSAPYFITRAIAPAGGSAGDAFRLRTVRPGDATPGVLADAETIVLCETGPVSEETARALRDWTESGGLLIAFLDRQGSAAAVAALERTAGAEGFWPWMPGSPVDAAGSQRGGAFITRAAARHPVMEALGQRWRSTLERVWFGVIARPAHEVDPAGILLWFEDGSPALGVQRAGRGTAVLAGFSLDASVSDFGRYGVFVALIHEVIASFSATASAEASAPAGAFLAIPIASGDHPVLIRAPDGTQREVQITSNASGATAPFERAHRPGLYLATAAGRDAGAGAVNVDPAESALDRLELATIAARLKGLDPAAHVDATSAEASAGDTTSIAPDGRPLWHIALIAAALALACEVVLLAVWRT